VGEEGRSRQRQAGGCPNRCRREDEGSGAGEPWASSGQWDPAQGVCLFVVKKV